MTVSRIIRSYQIAFMVLATYGLFYFSYKFHTPWLGASDFLHYYPMYLEPLDMGQQGAPFIYRQLSAVITNAIYESGVYYPTKIAFADPTYSQRIFFSALLSNYLALLLTAVVVMATVYRRRETVPLLAPIVGGLLCFLSFFTQLSVITGLADGWSWFLLSLIFYAYISRMSWFLVPMLAISIFQRETIPFIVCVFSSIDFLINIIRRKASLYYLGVIVASSSSFLGYLLVRTIIMPVEGYAHQLEMRSMLAKVPEYFPPTQELILQGLISQNVIFVFVITVILTTTMARYLGKPVQATLLNSGLLQVCGTLLAIYAVGLAAGAENNIGRLGAMITPFVASITASHLADVEDLVLQVSNTE